MSSQPVFSKKKRTLKKYSPEEEEAMANLRRKYQGDYYKIPKTAIEELFANFPGIAKHSNPTEKENYSYQIHPQRGRSNGES